MRIADSQSSYGVCGVPKFPKSVKRVLGIKFQPLA